eukprot:gene22603-27113_t
MGDVSLTPLGITVLGLLSERSMHPYEMYQLASVRRGDQLVKIKPGSLYHTVSRLEKQELLASIGTDREGNRPERTTYEITARGREALEHQLREMLAVPMLRIRLAHLDKTIAKFEADYEALKAAEKPRIFTVGADYAHALTVAEREWIGALVTDIESGEMPWLSQELLDRLAGSAGLKMEKQVNPWHALWALCIGFFMILVDSTIVAVANPAIMEDLGTDINKVVWVTSAYLLAYAVPLLVTGRLGDRFGPKNLYMIGLVLFTGASLWCGLSGSVEMLIVARAFQGLGAAMMTPQTMAVITRTFAPNKRGAAMGLWGAVAGVATLVGPLAGGVLVDNLGWEWIFIVNVPVGVIAFLLAWKLVPSLPTSEHKFDIPGVILSAAGMFLLVFGIQEGSSLIGAGVVLLAVFVFYQSRNKNEPLLPLELFKDRNFSLANV